MPQPGRPTAGTLAAEQVRARIAAINQLLARSRQRASQAMAHAQDVDRLLHSTAQRSDVVGPAEATRSEHLIEAMKYELATHLLAVEMHEAAAQQQADQLHGGGVGALQGAGSSGDAPLIRKRQRQ